MSKKVEAIYQESCEILDNLRKDCYACLSLNQILLLRKFESKIQKDLEQLPESYYKNLIVAAALTDTFYAIKKEYLTQLPDVEGSKFAYSDGFNSHIAFEVLNEALLTPVTSEIQNAINSDTTQMIFVLLANFANPSSFLYYYTLFIKHYRQNG